MLPCLTALIAFDFWNIKEKNNYILIGIHFGR